MQAPCYIDDFIRVDPKTGLYVPQWWKTEVQPYWLFCDEQSFSGSIAISTLANVSAVYKLKHWSVQGGDNGVGNPMLITHAVFEDSGAAGTAASTGTIMLKDMGDRTQFMNQPIHYQNFYGTAQLPSRLSEPLFLPTMHSLLATLTSLDGANAQTLRPFFVGKIFYPWAPTFQTYPEEQPIIMQAISKYLERRKYIFPFWLTTESVITLTANGTAEVEGLVGDDGHFEATHLISQSTGEYAMELLNPDTHQTISNGPISSAVAMGTAQLPQILPVPWLIESGNRVRFRLTDLSGSSNVVRPTLRGRKIRAPLKYWEEVKNDLAIPQNLAV